jgi:hypothetical protein
LRWRQGARRRGGGGRRRWGTSSVRSERARERWRRGGDEEEVSISAFHFSSRISFV